MSVSAFSFLFKKIPFYTQGCTYTGDHTQPKEKKKKQRVIHEAVDTYHARRSSRLAELPPVRYDVIIVTHYDDIMPQSLSHIFEIKFNAFLNNLISPRKKQ